MITMHHPPPKHHPSQRPGIPLFQRSVLPSHPLTTPRPPTIVYPHRVSSTPLASASTPPHEPYLFLAADPTQRASSYVPLRVHRVTVAPTPSYVVGGERGAAEAARAGKLRPTAGASEMKGPATRGGIARSASPAVTVPAVPAVTTTRTSSVSGSTDSPRSAGGQRVR